MNMVLGALGLFALAVAVRALFAGYEAGLAAADRIRVAHRAEEERDANAAALLRHLTAPERMITTVLIGANGALIVGAMALSSVLPNAIWLVALVAAPVFLVFAEIIPKTVFRRHPNRLSLAFFPVMRVCGIVLSPLVLPVLWTMRALRWVLGVQESPTRSLLTTQEDFRSLVDESAARGTIQREEQEMIHSVMDLAAIQAQEIMVPRIDIQAVPVDTTRDQLVEAFDSTGRTRIPVYRETIDNVVGIVIAHDVLIDPHPEDQSIERYIKEVRHVPDTKPVGELLQEMKAMRQHMAVVVNEYGGTDGIITMEDILEEIFGDIQDEHDLEPRQILQVGTNAYVVDARTPLEEFAEAINTDLSEIEAETVGGWVMQLAQRIPKQGERVQHDRLKFTILEGTHNQLLKMRVDVRAGNAGPIG